jgi:hypothetical protein
MFLKLIILVLVVILVGTAGEAYLRRKFNIEKRNRIYGWVNKVQACIEIALFVVYIVGIWFVIENIFLYMISFFTVLNSLRAFMHWKYEPETKHHILFLYELVVLVVVWAVAYWWIFV